MPRHGWKKAKSHVGPFRKSLTAERPPRNLKQKTPALINVVLRLIALEITHLQYEKSSILLLRVVVFISFFGAGASELTSGVEYGLSRSISAALLFFFPLANV